jgi:hypothetical protein
MRNHIRDCFIRMGGVALGAALVLSCSSSPSSNTVLIASSGGGPWGGPSTSDLPLDKLMPPLIPGHNLGVARPQALLLGQATPTQQGFVQFFSANQKLTFDDLAATKPVASPQAFLQMKQYFSNLYTNVTPSRTITVGSQTFECIPIRQQPSLRASEPIDSPPESNDPPQGHSLLGYQNMNCGNGEIPLKQTSVPQIANYQTLRDYFAKDQGLARRLTNQSYRFQSPSNIPVPQIPHPGNGANGTSSDGYVHRYAIKYNQAVQAVGVTAELNVWSPLVSGADMSLSQSWIVDSNGNATQTLESGWQVRMDVDKVKAVPFIYSTQDNYGNTGCYNLDCAGFVQVTNQIVFAVFNNEGYSIVNGAQRTLSVKWLRKSSTGNWWLKLNGIWIGYYPSGLFTGTLASASPSVTLEFGGENTGATPRVEMGSGRFAASGYRQAAFAGNLAVVSSSGALQPFAGLTYVTNPACYSLQESGPPPDRVGEVFFYFGGPGTADQNCAASFR